MVRPDIHLRAPGARPSHRVTAARTQIVKERQRDDTGNTTRGRKDASMSRMESISRPTEARAAEDIVTHDAHALIPDGVTARIVLDEQVYTLRITRAGKLILTK